MPWTHAIASREEQQDALFFALLGDARIRLTPLYLLVGGDGIIAASSPDLVVTNLAERIDELLATSAPASDAASER